jgi:hypothetical protein
MKQLLFGLVLLVAVSSARAKSHHRGFIRAEGAKFIDASCYEYNFVGANV